MWNKEVDWPVDPGKFAQGKKKNTNVKQRELSKL